MINYQRLVLLVITLVFVSACAQKQILISPSQVGAEQLELYLPLLKGKRVGLVVNQTSRAKDQHLVDVLLENDVNIQMIFAPEHGFRGDHDAGATVRSTLDVKTGIPIQSIYGKNKKPPKEIMQQLDVIIFDIQDVGVRFYTYISSMHYMMQAAAENKLEFIVLDRPNPNIQYIDGPVLESEFRSFVGIHPIPVLHGLTIGELAQMILGEGWLNINAKQQNLDLKLTVIPVANYTRNDRYSLPVKPSPNLPNDKAIELYPSLCLFEPTYVSIGRGTDSPFQIIGHNEFFSGSYQFTPKSKPGAARDPKFKGVLLTGLDLRKSDIKGFDLTLFYQWFQLFKQAQHPFIQSAQFMDKLAGTDQIRLGILEGKSLKEIEDSWQPAIEQFKSQRQPYLIYK